MKASARRTAVAAVMGVAAACGPAEDLTGSRGDATASVQVDLGAERGPFPFAPGRQLSSVSGQWSYGAPTTEALARLRLTHARVWIELRQGYDVDRRSPMYERYYAYLDAWASRAAVLVVNWRTNYDPLVTGGAFSEAELAAAQVEMLAHYKRRHPAIEYVECENEPETIAPYYPKYRFLYRVVNAVNALGLGGPRLQVGGPTLNEPSPNRIPEFLDRYAADPDPAKRLDFIAYHQYLFGTSADPYANKDNPAMAADERARLEGWLAARGLPTDLPALLTETGLFPIDRKSALGFEADLHIQAAGLASLHYFYADQPRLMPFHWTVNHPDNDRKDMFVDTTGGVPRPYYGAVWMQSMLPAVRCAATASPRTPRGIGLYALAGAGDDAAAVMIWNYQWTYGASYETDVAVAGLARLPAGPLRIRQWRLAADLHSGEPALVEDAEVARPSGGTYRPARMRLEANELRLLVVTAGAGR